VDIYSAICSVECFTENFLKYGRMYLVMCDLTLVSTEHFTLQESYSVVATTKPIFNRV
jgi:hypothetical protein